MTNLSMFYKCLLRHFFLNVPSFSRHHSRQLAIAFSRASGELAGWKSSQVLVASRRHISAKKRVCNSSLESSSISSSIEYPANAPRFSVNSWRFIKLFKRSQNRSRRCAVAHSADHFQRQTNQFVFARRNFAQIQTFDDDDFFFE